MTNEAKDHILNSIKKATAEAKALEDLDGVYDIALRKAREEYNEDFLGLLTYFYMVFVKAENEELTKEMLVHIKSHVDVLAEKYGVSGELLTGIRVGEDMWRNGNIGQS